MCVRNCVTGVCVHALFLMAEVTGEVQWEDPGDVPHEDSTGRRYWISASGETIYHNPEQAKYTWVEQFSADMKKVRRVHTCGGSVD